MKPKDTNRFFYVSLPLIVAVLVYGVYELMALRLQVGDVYPPYSSLRTDPMGTKALYDGLAQIQNVSVERNYGPMENLEEPLDTVLLDLGEDRSDVLDIPELEGRALEAKILQGARVVVAFKEENLEFENTHSPMKENTTLYSTPGPSTTPVSGDSRCVSEGLAGSPERPMKKLWGVEVYSRLLPQKKIESLGTEKLTNLPVIVDREGSLPIPSSLRWHSSIYFNDLDPAWKVLYLRDTSPVAIERAIGKGTLILMTDPYMLSNEAMQKDLHSDLLVYLVGDKRRVVFDETHLGVYESSNTATLARKYGLQGFFLGLLFLAGLFIWRNSMCLVPPASAESLESSAGQSGKDQSTGLMNLLRRNIPEAEILGICFEQWKRTSPQGGQALARKTREMETELENWKAERRDIRKPLSGRSVLPSEGYLRLVRILNKRR